MTDTDLQLRLARAEEDIKELYEHSDGFRGTMSQLNITIALLEQTLKNVQAAEAKREATNQRYTWVFFGSLITAAVGFLVSGGLAI